MGLSFRSSGYIFLCFPVQAGNTLRTESGDPRCCFLHFHLIPWTDSSKKRTEITGFIKQIFLRDFSRAPYYHIYPYTGFHTVSAWFLVCQHSFCRWACVYRIFCVHSEMDFGPMHRFSVAQNSNINPAIKSSAVLLELPPEMGYDRFRESLTKIQ